MGNALDKKTANILWFDQVTIDDVSLVGGKNASLGEMYTLLTEKGVQVPNGFAITANAYRYLLDEAGLMIKIKEVLKDLDTHDMDNLSERGKKVRMLIRDAEFPEDLKKEIISAYENLSKQYGKNTDVAVRSSATAEDLPDASFAGQQETYLNITGPTQLINACKDCFASLFTNRAISYRQDKGFDHFSIALSIGVQKMVRSDLACSGVMFSIDTESGFKDVVYITGAYGLGENVVQGAVNPDEFYVHKPTLKKGFRPIISKSAGEKKVKMIYDENGSEKTKNVRVPILERKKFVLNDDEILKLAEWACIIEDHYSGKKGKLTPMDMEWAKDGKTGQLFIVQARPETVHSQKDSLKLEKYVLDNPGKVIITGAAVGDKIGAGPVHLIRDVKNISSFKKGEILVTEMTDPDWEPIMKIASAIVTDKGGRTCHAAIISREMGIPCIVGTIDGSERLKDGQKVTVDCSKGTTGTVYDGEIAFRVDTINLKNLPETKTKIMMNLGNPDQAFEFASLPAKGVGLAREEFIINSFIKVHPRALLEFDKVKDPSVRKTIQDMTFGYENKADYFIDRLSFGVGKLAAAFYPHPVIVRLSDFKSNEYANLIGGKYFEPTEDNPMIGWRGASRYYDDNYKDAFGLECKAMKIVREKMGLDNVQLMIPFCRTVEEGNKVLAEMEKHGLRKGENGLKIICMCEIPSNVIMAEEFLDIFDGFSIGSNDLTQLTLGLDRDSELVSGIYDERDDAVKKMLSQVITIAKKRKKYIGICGQGPSDHEDFAEFLVELGIDSMSLNPDTVIKTTIKIAEKEKQLKVSGAK